MKNFFLVILAAAILSNSAIAMEKGDKKSLPKALYFSHIASGGTAAMNENGTIVPHNRIEVVRNAFNPESFLLGLFGAAGLVASVYEGSFTGSVFSALTMVNAAMEFKQHTVRIKKYNDKTLVGNISITGEPGALEKAVALEQAGVDALNEAKVPQIKKAPLVADEQGALGLAAAIVAEQEKDGLVQ